ncbi:uncharacterized protein LOC133728031 [Rosa rugosa]|uniref:uncharacterized protein LOC133728031 n=1 Tax=Rosa rugosa TaxID=74645 RepID=UPI002B40A34D|nr:uncharacterized protein LOC133728031 [Rosa rugosa]
MVKMEMHRTFRRVGDTKGSLQHHSLQFVKCYIRNAKKKGQTSATFVENSWNNVSFLTNLASDPLVGLGLILEFFWLSPLMLVVQKNLEMGKVLSIDVSCIAVVTSYNSQRPNQIQWAMRRAVFDITKILKLVRRLYRLILDSAKERENIDGAPFSASSGI